MIKAMLLLAVAVAVITISCQTNVETKTTPFMIEGMGVDVFTIDSCEYIRVNSGNGTWGSHKGNCKFCAERNKKAE